MMMGINHSIVIMLQTQYFSWWGLVNPYSSRTGRYRPLPSTYTDRCTVTRWFHIRPANNGQVIIIIIFLFLKDLTFRQAVKYTLTLTVVGVATWFCCNLDSERGEKRFWWGNLPYSHTVLWIVKTVDGAEEIRQRVLGVAANECKEDPRSEQRRLGVPALLREISPDRNAAGRQQEEQDNGEEGRPTHRDNKRRINILLNKDDAAEGLVVNSAA